MQTISPIPVEYAKMLLLPDKISQISEFQLIFFPENPAFVVDRPVSPYAWRVRIERLTRTGTDWEEPIECRSEWATDPLYTLPDSVHV